MNIYIYSSWKYAPLVVGAYEAVERMLWKPKIVGGSWGPYLSDYPVDSDWCRGLHEFLDKIDDEYFMLLLEDYYVVGVNQPMMDEVLEVMERNPLVQKVDLSGSVKGFAHSRFNRYFVKADEKAQYRSSLQAAVWRKDYLKKMCPAEGSAWLFETHGHIRAMGDGALILGCNVPVVNYLNLMRRGVWYGKDDYDGRTHES